MTARLAKTDALDARMLARFAAFTADEPRAALPDARTQELADMVSRLTQLTDLHQAESCRVQQAATAKSKASIKTVLKVLDAQIEAMQEAIDAFIAKDAMLSQKVKLLRSCKGVGPKSAQAILAGARNRRPQPPPDRRPRRRRAHHQRSGSSIDHASITGGRKALRDILFMAALTASKHNPTFKVFHQRLRANGSLTNSPSSPCCANSSQRSTPR